MPPEWVNWEHLSDHHRYVQENDSTTCMVCGRGMENHWFPKQNPRKVLDEAMQTVEDYINRQMLE